MNLHLQHSSCNSQSKVRLTGSKSETNRLLLLQALYPEIVLENASNSDDSEVMIKALHQHALPSTHYSTPHTLIDIHHAGTAMRFLTAYFAIQENREVVITGSERMKERPIGILVDALKELGAEIAYLEKEGFPPIKVRGKKLVNSKVSLLADTSSQYSSALLLIAPKLENGLELTLEGKITSIPYIRMTLALLNEIGVETSFLDNKITVKPHNQNPAPKTLTVESDWSSASYFYSIVALSDIGMRIKLSSYKQNSLQGDSVLTEIYRYFGVETTFENNTITLSKSSSSYLPSPVFELGDSPDIAQTIAITCFGLGIGCHLTGLHTLKIKETDRLEALKTELEKLGATVIVTNDTLTLEAASAIQPNIAISTYNDHRMAMAFAPLALKTDIIINDAEVVSKSYPDFWDDLKSIGFQIEAL